MKQKITHILKTNPWSINLHLEILTYQKTKLQTYQYYHPCSNANRRTGKRRSHWSSNKIYQRGRSTTASAAGCQSKT